MNYNTSTNRELSKLLHEKGCESESFMCWFGNGSDKWMRVANERIGNISMETPIHPSYNFEDCIRRENAVKVFKGTSFMSGPLVYATPTWKLEVSKLLDLYNEDEVGEKWQRYVINCLKK